MTNSVSSVTSRLNSIYPIVLVYFYAREGGGKKIIQYNCLFCKKKNDSFIFYYMYLKYCLYMLFHKNVSLVIVVPAAWDDVGWLQRRRESILPLGVPGLWHVSWDRNHAYHRHVRGQDENHDGTLKQKSTNPEKNQQCTNQLKVCATDYCHD